jgi:hypothetical protein
VALQSRQPDYFASFIGGGLEPVEISVVPEREDAQAAGAKIVAEVDVVPTTRFGIVIQSELNGSPSWGPPGQGLPQSEPSQAQVLSPDFRVPSLCRCAWYGDDRLRRNTEMV